MKKEQQKEVVTSAEGAAGEGQSRTLASRGGWELECDEPDTPTGEAYTDEVLRKSAHESVSEYRKAKKGDHQSPESWWAANQGLYPRVAAVARRRLCAQASSATFERSFSKAGRIVTRRRKTLAPSHVEQMTLIAWNSDML